MKDFLYNFAISLLVLGGFAGLVTAWIWFLAAPSIDKGVVMLVVLALAQAGFITAMKRIVL